MILVKWLLKFCFLCCVVVTSTTTPKPPGWSWDTLPVHWFSANSTSQLGEEMADQIVSRHSLAIINGQGHAYWAQPAQTGVEDKMIEAGKILKQASQRQGLPEITVLAYFNSVIDWYPYQLHTWLQEDVSRYLTEINGNLVFARKDHLNNTMYVPDFTQRIVRNQWIILLKNTTDSIYIDGVFIDQGHWNCPIVSLKHKSLFKPGQQDLWAQSHWDMLLDLRNVLSDQIIILNNHNTSDYPSQFDHEYETFNGSVPQIQALQQDAVEQRLAIAHNEGTFFITLPAFLLGAGDYAYYQATTLRGDNTSPADPMWVEPAWDGWRPE